MLSCGFYPKFFQMESMVISSTGSASSALWVAGRSHQHRICYGDFMHISLDEMGISWEFQCKI
jgi:hypothetical protein